MGALWASAPPVSPEFRVLAALLGGLLGGLLASGVSYRQFFSWLVLPALFVAAGIAISLHDHSDALGIWSFVVGAVLGTLAAWFVRPAAPREAQTGKHRGRLMAAAAVAGPLLGLVLFAVWWWSEDFNTEDVGFFACAFVGIGAFAGALCAGLVWLGGVQSEKKDA